MEELEEAAAQFEYTDGVYGFKQGAKWMLDKLQDFDTWKEWKDINL